MSGPHDDNADPTAQDLERNTQGKLDIYQLYQMEHLSNHEFWALAREIVHNSHTRITDIHEQYLECRLKNGKCVLSLEVLREVASPPFHFSQFPSAPAWMLGVGAWREDILPIIDFEAYLTHTPADQEGAVQGAGLLLIASYEHIMLGLYILDALPIHLTEASLQELSPPPPLYAHLPNGAIKGKVEPETLILDSGILFQHIVQMLTV